jgi:hypothetical protein
MGDFFLVIEHFQVGKVQRSEISVGKIISGIPWLIFQWRKGRHNYFWVYAVSDLSFEGLW